MKDFLLNKKNAIVHFIGINGISMSGLAEIVMGLGYKISGSDIESSNRTKKLMDMGANIYLSHNADLMGKPDLVVYTAAISKQNCEYIKAKKLGIPLMDRAVLLGKIMSCYKYGIGVSGAHGKTTTTAMVSYLLEKCGMDPTIHIGGEADFIKGTVKVGNSEYFVTEADEFNDSFLKLSPYIGVVLNIDYDHVDWYQNLGKMQESFIKYASSIPDDGYLIACYDDTNTHCIYDKVSCNKIYYGLSNIHLHYSACDITFDSNGYGSFDFYIKGNFIKRVKLGLQGRHNILNSLSAIASCHLLGCDIDRILGSLETMKGAKRRMDLVGEVNGIKVITDYAHHPTEIDITLETVSNMEHNDIWAVFEPHTFSRVKVLFDDFSKCFKHADHVIMADIYNDREIFDTEINSEKLAMNIAKTNKDAIYLPSYEAITMHLYKNVKPGDIVMILGSKNIVFVGDALYDKLSHS